MPSLANKWQINIVNKKQVPVSRVEHHMTAVRHSERSLKESWMVQNRCSLDCFCIQRSKTLNTPLCLLSDGHTDSDILMKWRNPKIEIGNKEMAQFSVGEAVLTTQVNMFSTGKIGSPGYLPKKCCRTKFLVKDIFLFFDVVKRTLCTRKQHIEIH